MALQSNHAARMRRVNCGAIGIDWYCVVSRSPAYITHSYHLVRSGYVHSATQPEFLDGFSRVVLFSAWRLLRIRLHSASVSPPGSSALISTLLKTGLICWRHQCVRPVWHWLNFLCATMVTIAVGRKARG